MAAFANDGYKREDWSHLIDLTASHTEMWKSVKDLPDTCEAAADALNRALWATRLEWPFDKWLEVYAKYVDAQGRCEQAVSGKPDRRVLPANLMPHKRPGEYTG